jgi:hypothetical protein
LAAWRSSEAALEAHIKVLEAQNADLESKVALFRDQLVQVEEARDHFWKSKVALLEESPPRASIEATKSKVEVDPRTNDLLNEWESWARSLYSNLNQGDVCRANAKELRFLLTEMLLSSIAHRSLLNNLRSLRYQKKLLLRGVPQRPVLTKDLSIRSVVVIAIAVTRLIRDRSVRAKL